MPPPRVPSNAPIAVPHSWGRRLGYDVASLLVVVSRYHPGLALAEIEAHDPHTKRQVSDIVGWCVEQKLLLLRDGQYLVDTGAVDTHPGFRSQSPVFPPRLSLADQDSLFGPLDDPVDNPVDNMGQPVDNWPKRRTKRPANSSPLPSPSSSPPSAVPPPPSSPYTPSASARSKKLTQPVDKGKDPRAQAAVSYLHDWCKRESIYVPPGAPSILKAACRDLESYSAIEIASAYVAILKAHDGRAAPTLQRLCQTVLDGGMGPTKNRELNAMQNIHNL